MEFLVYRYSEEQSDGSCFIHDSCDHCHLCLPPALFPSLALGILHHWSCAGCTIRLKINNHCFSNKILIAIHSLINLFLSTPSTYIYTYTHSVVLCYSPRCLC